MKKLFFKSTGADLQKLFQSIEITQKNVLYLTYRLDLLIKRCDTLLVDKGLQRQVDEYMERDDDMPVPPLEEQEV